VEELLQDAHPVARIVEVRVVAAVADRRGMSHREGVGQALNVVRREVAAFPTDDQRRAADLPPLPPVVASGQIGNAIDHHGRVKRRPQAPLALLKTRDPRSRRQPLRAEELDRMGG
jgi:hypothetical protein